MNLVLYIFVGDDGIQYNTYAEMPAVCQQDVGEVFGWLETSIYQPRSSTTSEIPNHKVSTGQFIQIDGIVKQKLVLGANIAESENNMEQNVYSLCGDLRGAIQYHPQGKVDVNNEYNNKLGHGVFIVFTPLPFSLSCKGSTASMVNPPNIIQ
jgi:hypothetical protein